MRDADPFRGPCRAGGVHDVREVVRLVHRQPVDPGPGVELGGVAVDEQHGAVEVGKPVAHAGLGQQNACLRLRKLVREPCRRVFEVEGDVGAACLQHGEERHDRACRALHA